VSALLLLAYYLLRVSFMNLEKILADHKLWLANDPKGTRADLYGADLYGADLRDANLRDANLRDANLRDANLRGANLYGANLYGTDLRGTDLSDTDLRGTDLRNANLSDTNIHGTNIHGTIIDLNWICSGQWYHLANIGSENGTLELYDCGDNGWFVRRGCFRGSLDSFKAKVVKTHGNNAHAKKYLAIVSALCS